MAGESSQPADPSKMASRSPAAFVLRRLVGLPVPEDFNGCKCPRSKCANALCPCAKDKFRCTSKCQCSECDNIYGVKGSVSNTEPVQGATGLDLNKLPSSNIQTEQAGTSSMAGGSTQITDPNEMAAPSPAARFVGRPVPADFGGCKCPNTRCNTGKCVCSRELYRCTSKCKCRGCANRFGTRGDSSTEPGQGGTGGVSNGPGEAVQTTLSSNIESEQADDASSVSREPPQMQEQPTQSEGFDLNKLPPSD